MICMTSSTGVMAAAKRGLFPVAIPSGIPTASASTTAASIWASVSMLEVHSPRTPTAAKPAMLPSARRQPPKIAPSAAATASTPGQPRNASSASNPPTRPPIPARRRPGITRPSRFCSTQSRTPLRVWKNG